MSDLRFKMLRSILRIRAELLEAKAIMQLGSKSTIQHRSWGVPFHPSLCPNNLSKL